MNSWWTGVVTLAVMASSVACATQEAHRVAANLGRITSSYDAARAEKVKVETAYYAQQLRLLRGALGGSFAAPEGGKQGLETNVPVDKTVAYGRIVTGVTRDSHVLAEILATPGQEARAWAQLLDFFEHGLQDDRDAFLESEHRQQQLREELLSTLLKLDRQEARLRAVRDHLLKLERQPSASTRLPELYGIGRAIFEQLQLTEGLPK